MEHIIRYTNDQYGNGDYARLDRWPGYKTSPNDNTSLIYTSDYGSYSSQESNHSGTTYSNLADCEEALYSPTSVAYDVPPPQLFGSMEKRREKPLPPPRMTSRHQPTAKPRVLEPVREKKISFDDSSMTKSFNSRTNPDDNVPSFATLPRKKKLVSGSTTTPQPAAQVTWMKEVAQKVESINRLKSVEPGSSTKKPHGILKNRIEEQRKKGDTTGYIQRNTVQRILDQQRKVLNRQSTCTSATPSQFYKSMPSLRPAPHSDLVQSSKAWEYNYNENNSHSSTTAQVIGVFEPNSESGCQKISHHTKQNSNETEFEFPPPPTDYDIEQIMQTPDIPREVDAISSPKSDFTPLNLACNGQSGVYEPKSTNAQSNGEEGKEYRPRPPVPQRPKKPISITQRQCDDYGFSFNNHTSLQSDNTIKPKAIVPPRRAPAPRKLHSNTVAMEHPRKFPADYVRNTSADDIVLPPPPQFQETSTPLGTQQPSYGDYELLSPEVQYQCAHHPLTNDSAKSTSYGHSNYHQKIVIERLENNIANKLKFDSNSNTALNPSTPKIRDYNSYLPQTSHHVNGFPSHSLHHDSKKDQRNRFANHQHQHSTEL